MKKVNIRMFSKIKLFNKIAEKYVRRPFHEVVSYIKLEQQQANSFSKMLPGLIFLAKE